jgi:hypothetical protein
MNARIKELADLAGMRNDKYGMFFSKDEDNDGVDLEKFAELIVRECIHEIQTVKDYKSGNAEPRYATGFDDGMFVAIRTIEEHFGVE